MGKTFLISSYTERHQVKGLGAIWDPKKKQWYVPSGMDIEPFERWLPQTKEKLLPEIPLESPAVSYYGPEVLQELFKPSGDVSERSFALKSSFSELETKVFDWWQKNSSVFPQLLHTRLIFQVPVSSIYSRCKDPGIRMLALLVRFDIQSAEKDASWPVAAVLDEFEPNEIAAEISLFETGFPFTRVNTGNLAKKMIALMGRITERKPLQTALKAPLNYTEFLFNEAMERLIGGMNAESGTQYRFSAQVAVQTAIGEISWKDRFLASIVRERNLLRQLSRTEFDALRNDSKYGRVLQDSILDEYRQISSFDFLISFTAEDDSDRLFSPECPQAARSRPALAIELDGPMHRQPNRQFGDFKKELLCLRAGLSMLRVHLYKINWLRFQDSLSNFVKHGIFSSEELSLEFLTFMISYLLCGNLGRFPSPELRNEFKLEHHPDGSLTGSFRRHAMPRLTDFCTTTASVDMRLLREEFAIKWLFRKSRREGLP